MTFMLLYLFFLVCVRSKRVSTVMLLCFHVKIKVDFRQFGLINYAFVIELC